MRRDSKDGGAAASACIACREQGPDPSRDPSDGCLPRAGIRSPYGRSPYAGLAGRFITDQYTLMRRHRDTVGRGWSDRLLSALRAFDGVYEPNVIEEIKRFGGSNVYARTIAMKCRGTSSLLRDVYLGAERPWGIEPASDPEVPPEIIQAIGEHISQEVTTLVQAHYQAAQAQQAHAMALPPLTRTAQPPGNTLRLSMRSIPRISLGRLRAGTLALYLRAFPRLRALALARPAASTPAPPAA